MSCISPGTAWAPRFARIVNPTAGRGAVCTSWFRDQTTNARVGGALTSQHLIGTAVDLVPGAGDTVAAMAQRFRYAGWPQVIEYRGHVHVALFPRNPFV